MIADLIESCNIRLITRNIMSVYSTKKEYTDNFVSYLKTHNYLVNNDPCTADSIIGYTKGGYNIYENIFRYVSNNKEIRFDKFLEFLNYFDLNHLLWVHFYQLNDEDRLLVETLLLFACKKPIIILDYIDSSKYKSKLYSLMFHVGLEDRLVIVPFTNIKDAVNNSTCQCYVKSNTESKIQSYFSNEFLVTEFNSQGKVYYDGLRPAIYSKSKSVELKPYSYTYSLYELILIFLFSIKLLYTRIHNWRLKRLCQ